MGDRATTGFGGKGANQAVMARNLGSKVSFCTCVGEDANGIAYEQRLRDMGVCTAHMHVHSGISTGVAPSTCEPAPLHPCRV